MPYPDTLVIYHKQLGDVLLLQPALEMLAKQHGSPVALATAPGFTDLLTLMPGPVLPAPYWLPKTRQVFCLEKRPAALLQALRAPLAQRTLVLTKADAPWWHQLLFHEMHVLPGKSEYRAALLQSMVGGDPTDFQPPRLNLPPATWQHGDLPDNYAVIHPTSAWQRKTWSPEHWAEALSGLEAAPTWVITSGTSPWEMEHAQQIASRLGHRAINLAGHTNLRQYLAVLAAARFTLCVDGSASHISSAFGRPTLTLFGPTNPLHWHYPTSLSRRLWAADYCSKHKPSVDDIPVAAVKSAILSLMESSHA